MNIGSVNISWYKGKLFALDYTTGQVFIDSWHFWDLRDMFRAMKGE